ncbi:MAG: zinc ribbon domain-containing protein [Dehalococcoidia bacterium]|nr:zinc ribbon domain-containing protein [Dehalococcoidia bacterium]
MPVYEYWCPHCRLRFELMRPLSQSGEGAPCPKCRNQAPRAVSRCASISKGDNGMSTPIGGSSCSGCSSSSCSSCGG